MKIKWKVNKKRCTHPQSHSINKETTPMTSTPLTSGTKSTKKHREKEMKIEIFKGI